MKLINPATEEVIGTVTHHAWPQVQAALAAAASAFGKWLRTDIAERGNRMRTAGRLLRERRGEFAGLMGREMGKPIAAAEAEIDKCAAACDFFADQAAGFLAPIDVPSSAHRSYVRHDPMGCVLGIMPWNFPFWQVIRFAVPTLMAGNVVILKHAPNVPACADAIERLFADAGMGGGIFARLFLSNEMAAKVIAEPVICGVSLTGSERAGRAVAAEAGRCLKKTVMELGGSDPFIVLGDADIPAVARAAALARCTNSGQSCIAAKRFIVVGAQVEVFETAMAGAMSHLKVGDPAGRATQVGPLARLDLLDHLHEQVIQSVKAGARLVSGGRRLPRRGYFYEPTVLAGVRKGMAAFDEEMFGPVAAVIGAADVDEAVRLANDTPYGLGASVWGRDAAAAESLAARLNAGSIFINGAVVSDVRLPFGGIKASGWGRELAAAGMREFTNAKSVWVAR
jgi:succinate-semialdehyde dehydrogenase/glutarate-semialdehyde dehydrogenase